MSLARDGLFLLGGYLNTEDVSPTDFASLTYPKGQLGKTFYLNDTLAAKYSGSLGTCFGGWYQVVQFVAGSSNANARGGPLRWSDRTNFVVTPDMTAVTENDFAGIGLMVNTKGNYGIMQCAGKCSILYRAAVTSAVNGNLVLQLTTTATFDAIADATGSYISGGALGLKNIVGVALEAPVNASVKLASIWPRNFHCK